MPNDQMLDQLLKTEKKTSTIPQAINENRNKQETFKAPVHIGWVARWEFDKNPDAFFDALDAVLEDGAEFLLALLGENFQTVPKAFIRARGRYGRRILQYGYVESRAEYIKWLQRGSIVISTAAQENFGISVVEAIRCGCMPLLPARLSYPEIIPNDFHSRVLTHRVDTN